MIGRVTCLGDPVVDILAYIEPSFFARAQIAPGGCLPVSHSDLVDLLALLSPKRALQRKSGGSAANVARGLALLDVGSRRKAVFAGMIGPDEAGGNYATELEALGVETRCSCSTDLPTATCLCLVTPDGQRTMRTCLSAAAELQSITQLPHDWLLGSSLLHMEGYMLYRPQLACEAAKAARSTGALVSLDLASFELVQNCSKTLLGLLDGGFLDIVFCNEEEAHAICTVLQDDAGVALDPVQKAQTMLLQYCKVSVVSLGSQGCIAKDNSGNTARCRAPTAQVIDTVGAGDFLTAGFLHAYSQGANLKACAEYGCRVGSDSVQRPGAELSPDILDRLPQMCDISNVKPLEPIFNSAASC